MKLQASSLLVVLGGPSALVALALFVHVGCGGGGPSSDRERDATPDTAPADGGADVSADAMPDTGADGPLTDGSSDAANDTDSPDVDPCVPACKKLETCGLDGSACSDYCVNSDPLRLGGPAWLSQCVVNASCASLATWDGLNPDPDLFKCMVIDLPNGGQGSPTVCYYCGLSQCLPERQACAQDPTCAQWLDCTNKVYAKGNTADWRACDQAYADAASKYAPVYSCLCNHCRSDCNAAVEPCGL
jgi:hypothetical protein